MAIRVLVVDDEPGILGAITPLLRSRGYDVFTAMTGKAALEAVELHQPDVVVLDLGLPDMNGGEVCRLIRDGGSMPIIILSARGAEGDKVAALDAGADDYVTKPFRLAELLARVRALLRRHPTGPGGAGSAIGVVRVDVDGRRAFFNDDELQLTAKEFDLLRVLVREQGKVVSREQLMREVWETVWFGSTKTLDMHISVLRRKLGDDAAQPRYIATVRGVGFRFERVEQG